MSGFGNTRHHPVVPLLVAATVLVSAQQMLGGFVQTPAEPAVQPHRHVRPPLTATAGPMLSAVVTGQFEEPVTPTPPPTAVPTPVPATPTPLPTPTAAAVLVESGIASTYGEGDGFEGNRTACGQVFHTGEIQVAHKSLPCGTFVRVEDSRTGRSVVAPVTDRGPYIKGRIVDLSWAAFKELDPAGPGLLHVNLYVVDN